MSKVLYIQQNLEIELKDLNINVLQTTGHSIPPKINPQLRFIGINKSLDNFDISDSKIKILSNNLKKLLGEDLSNYKFIFSFEKEESILTSKEIEVYNQIIDGSKSLFITINIDEIKDNSIVFLNNPSWILSEIESLSFFEFWKCIKKMDLGTIKKKYMFLNNHYSQIRFDILKFLYSTKRELEGNISFNYINFSDIDLDKNVFQSEITEFGIQYPKFYDALPTLSQISDSERNRDKLVGINHVATLNHFNYRIYLESFFEIITETHSHLKLPGVHISEKIHKPLRTALPFVYYGNPKLKSILESIGLSFNSPIYFFGMNREELFNHLEYILSKDLDWYHRIQNNYIDEYFNNMDKWLDFVRGNNKQILKFMYT